MIQEIKNTLQESVRTLEALSAQAETIGSIAQAMIEALKNKKKIVLFGNGGSASDAQHIAAEFVGRFEGDRPALPAIALTVNTSSLTAIGNDYGFDQIFSRQVEALVEPGDVVVGLSTSGRSPNVLAGITSARAKGAKTIGFTGKTGDKLKSLVDLCLCVPSTVTSHIQEGHIAAGHAICRLVDAALTPHLARLKT